MSTAADRRTTPRNPFLLKLASLDGFTPLYGRQAEQAALLRMMNRLAVGQPGVTVIHGVPGTGRSRLLRRGMALARVSGVQVLTALGTAPSSPAPYAFVRQLRPVRSTAGGPALAAEPPAEDSVQGWCRSLLAAASRPTLLALDDVQWADPESVQVIAGLLRRLASAPLGVLLTVAGADGEFPDTCAELLDQAAVLPDSRGLLLDLAPLGVPEIHAMCAASGLPVPAASDDAWWEGVTRLTRGSPWVTLRALDKLRREPALVSAVGLRTALSQQIEAADRDRATESAAKLTAGPLALIRGLAVGRGLLPLDRVTALVGLDEAELSAAVRTLRVHGLIGPGDPPRLRMTGCTAGLLAGTDGDERKRLHAQAARWAHRCDADEEALSVLLLNTVPLGEPWVPPVLRRTARALLARGRHAEAAELLERALREPLPLAERAEVLLEAAEAYAVIAPEAADRRIAELLSAAQVRPHVRAAAADLLLSRGEPQAMLPLSARLYGPHGAEQAGVPSRSRPTDVLHPGPRHGVPGRPPMVSWGRTPVRPCSPRRCGGGRRGDTTRPRFARCAWTPCGRRSTKRCSPGSPSAARCPSRTPTRPPATRWTWPSPRPHVVAAPRWWGGGGCCAPSSICRPVPRTPPRTTSPPAGPWRRRRSGIPRGSPCSGRWRSACWWRGSVTRRPADWPVRSCRPVPRRAAPGFICCTPTRSCLSARDAPGRHWPRPRSAAGARRPVGGRTPAWWPGARWRPWPTWAAGRTTGRRSCSPRRRGWPSGGAPAPHWPGPTCAVASAPRRHGRHG